MTSGALSGNMDNSNEVRINRCYYELNKLEIIKWIKKYGVVTSELEEIATTRDSDGKIVGTGSYTLKVRLTKIIPNISQCTVSKSNPFTK